MGLTFNLGRVSPSVFTDSSLNVGIGAAPSGTYKLEVTGTAKVSSTLLLGGALSGTSASFSGNVGIGKASSSFALDTLLTDASTNTILGVAQIGRASSGTAANGIGGNLQFTAQDTAGTQRTAAYITWKLAAVSSASPQGYLSIGSRNASEALIIADSGAATFSSSVSATSALFNTSIIIGNVTSLTGSWGNLTSVLQLGNSSTDKGYISVNEISGDDDINVVRYAYFDNTNWKRIGGGNPSRYSQRNAEHIFQYASSGADNSTITWNNALLLSSNGASTFSNDVTIGPNNGSFKGFGFSINVSSVSQGGLFPYSGVTGSGSDYSPTLFGDSSNNLYFCAGGSTTKKMTVNSNGIITILNLAAAGSRTVTADSSGNLSAASDSSLKQEDTTYTIEGLAEVLQLKPRAYKWLNDIEIRGEEAATEIGFFADEVNPIIPSAAPKGNDGLYGFYDRAVIAALVNAIQEQQAIITSLQDRLDKAGL